MSPLPRSAFFIYFHNRRKERERTEQFRAVAAQLAWKFADESPFNMIAGLEHFTLFNQGHSKQIKNFMYGEANGVKAAVFDYVFVTGSGKHRSVHHQSVTYLEPANLRVPYFSLRPEGFFTKIMQAFGYQDIDFGQRPEFSKQYLLRGQDEPAHSPGVQRQAVVIFRELCRHLRRWRRQSALRVSRRSTAFNRKRFSLNSPSP